MTQRETPPEETPPEVTRPDVPGGVWVARDKDAVFLCGWQDPNGRYRCDGEIVRGFMIGDPEPDGGYNDGRRIMYIRGPRKMVRGFLLVPSRDLGFTEDPPQSRVWRRTARARRALARGFRPTARHPADRGVIELPHQEPNEWGGRGRAAPHSPFYMTCGRCGRMNEVYVTGWDEDGRKFRITTRHDPLGYGLNQAQRDYCS
jgi:hypothetical protein